MLCQACGLGQMTYLGHQPARVIAGQDMVDVRTNVVKADNEKLCLGFEVAQLQYQMDARRDGASGVDRWSLLGTQLEVDLSFTFREVRHA